MPTAAPFRQKPLHQGLPESQPQPSYASIWLVVVLNDPVNLMAYVIMVFQKVFGYSFEKSKKHMLEVHEAGRSILWAGPKEQAEHYVYVLQSWQLHTLLLPSDFESPA